VDRAEAALAQVRQKHATERAALEKEREALERTLDTLKARQAKETDRLEARVDKAQEAYRAALEKGSD
jgi:hypothetical protein